MKDETIAVIHHALRTHVAHLESALIASGYANVTPETIEEHRERVTDIHKEYCAAHRALMDFEDEHVHG